MSEIINWFDNDKNKHETLVLTSGDVSTSTGVLITINHLVNSVDDESNPASEMEIDQLSYPYPVGGIVDLNEVTNSDDILDCTFWGRKTHTAYLKITNNTSVYLKVNYEVSDNGTSIIWSSALTGSTEIPSKSSSIVGFSGYYQHASSDGQGSGFVMKLDRLTIVPQFD